MTKSLFHQQHTRLNKLLSIAKESSFKSLRVQALERLLEECTYADVDMIDLIIEDYKCKQQAITQTLTVNSAETSVNKRKCKFCGKDIAQDKKSNAIFCSNSCKVKNCQQKLG